MHNDDNAPIWKSSPIVSGLEIVFRKLQASSPATLWLRSREAMHTLPDSERVAATRRRARRIDLYVISWIMLEVALYVVASHVDTTAVRVVIGAVATIRIVDIVQTAVNVTLFSSLRSGKRHEVANPERMVIGLGLNFLEAIACFGCLYLVSGRISEVSGPFDALYFSTVTQTTLGYGDILATGWARALVVAQVLFGVFFGLLMFARMLSLLAPVGTTEALVRQRSNDASDEP